MRYIIDEETMIAIADAIRSKTGNDSVIKGSDIADYIKSIRTTSAPILEGLTIKPTGQEIVEIPPFGSDGFGIVTVEGDEYLIPENIRLGVTIYGVEGLLNDSAELDTSDATATAEDIVESASAYVNGIKIIGTHTCKADPILSKAYAMPTGKEFSIFPDEDVDGFEEVIVEGDENLIPENILAGTTIYGVDGIVAFQEFEEEIIPSTKPQTIEPDKGFTAFTEVRVAGDSNLIPENILEGVSIFGVEGTAMNESSFTEDFTENKLQKDKVITPGPHDVTERPDKDFLGFSEVTVKGDDNLLSENIVEGITIFGVIGTASSNGEGSGGGSSGGSGRMFTFPSIKLIFEEITT